MRARKRDGNHRTIVDGLRKLGFWVWDTADLGNGFPDLLVVNKRTGRVVVMEVKDPAQVPSARKLTEAEERFHAAYPGPIGVVETLEDAVRLMTEDA